MTDPLFTAQAREIRALLDASHLSDEALAERAHIKAETLRKYLGGYQRCGERTMVALRTVAQMEVERIETAAGKRASKGSEMHDELMTYAGKLLGLPEKQRELAKQLIDEMHGGSASSGLSDSNIQDTALAVVRAEAERIRRGRKRTPTGGRRRRGHEPGEAAQEKRSQQPEPEGDGQ